MQNPPNEGLSAHAGAGMSLADQAKLFAEARATPEAAMKV